MKKIYSYTHSPIRSRYFLNIFCIEYISLLSRQAHSSKIEKTMNKATLFLTSLLLFGITACKENREAHITRLVQEWSGKEIQFPEHPVFTIQGKDTVEAPTDTLPYKIVVYVDSTGCMSCRLQLVRWKEMMATLDSLAAGKTSLLFYLCPKDLHEMQYILRRDAFRHPVCIDTTNAIQHLNHFPEEDNFQTFLVGKDNRVLAIGNPVHNPHVKDLYLSLISGKKISTQAPPATSVQLEKSEVELGTFSRKEEKTDSLRITNTGNHPLVIHDVVTDCGCLQAQFDKRPVSPGKDLLLRIVYRPDQTGYVNKTLRIYTNVEGGILTVRVKGKVE